jgi:hypothetical protein
VSTRAIDTSSGGFSAQNNLTVASSELSATSDGSYAPAPGSACAALLGGAIGAEGPEGVPAPVGKEVAVPAAAVAVPAPLAARPSVAASPAGRSAQAAPAASPSARGTIDHAAHSSRPRQAKAHHAAHHKRKRARRRFKASHHGTRRHR